MSEIITRCKKHGIVNREEVPQLVNDEKSVGQMQHCPYCMQRTEIDYPGENGILSQVDRSYLPPWTEE